MAVNVGRLAATLSLNSSAFSKGLKSAGGGIGSFVSKLGGVKAALAGLAGGLTVAGITSWVKGAADQIETTGKLAQELGLTTEELIGFQHGAQLAGVESEMVSSALRKFVRSLDEVGLSGMTTGEALKTIADQIAATDDPSAKAKLAFDAFGKSGQKLITVLSGGSAGLKEMEADARKLGITFSQLDVSQVDAANDAWDRAKKLLQGVAQQIAIQTAPLVGALSNAFTDAATSGVNAADITSSAWSKVQSVLLSVADAANDVPNIWTKIDIELAKFQKKLEEIDPTNELFPKEAENRIRRLDERIQKLTFGLNKQLLKKTPSELAEQTFDDLKSRISNLQKSSVAPLNLASLPSVQDMTAKNSGRQVAVKPAKSSLIPFTNASPALRGSADAFNRIVNSKQGRTAGVTADGRAITDKLTRVERLLDSILQSQRQTVEVSL